MGELDLRVRVRALGCRGTCAIGSSPCSCPFRASPCVPRVRVHGHGRAHGLLPRSTFLLHWASALARAQRRWSELQRHGEKICDHCCCYRIHARAHAHVLCACDGAPHVPRPSRPPGADAARDRDDRLRDSHGLGVGDVFRARDRIDRCRVRADGGGPTCHDHLVNRPHDCASHDCCYVSLRSSEGRPGRYRVAHGLGSWGSSCPLPLAGGGLGSGTVDMGGV